jgi:hypothetical protein
MTNSGTDVMIKFKNEPFSDLVKDIRELAALRCEYASMPPDERRKAADWEYHSEMAGDFLLDQDDYKNAFALYSAAEFGYLSAHR